MGILCVLLLVFAVNSADVTPWTSRRSRVAQSLDWLAVSSEYIGTYSVIASAEEKKGVVYWASLTAIPSNPMKGVHPDTLHIAEYATRRLPLVGDSLLVCGTGAKVTVFNLANPETTSLNVAVTSDFRVLSRGDAILDSMTQHLVRLQQKPELVERARRGGMGMSIPIETGAFRALFNRRRPSLIVPPEPGYVDTLLAMARNGDQGSVCKLIKFYPEVSVEDILIEMLKDESKSVIRILRAGGEHPYEKTIEYYSNKQFAYRVLTTVLEREVDKPGGYREDMVVDCAGARFLED